MAFTRAVIFAQAPFEVAATVTDAQYPPGATISGVPWRKEFTELQMRIINPSNKDYDDISLLIRPTEAIASIQQIVTNIPGVYFTDKNDFSARVADVKPTGQAIAVPLVLLATDAGYVMHCPRLPQKTSIQILIALTDVKWNPPDQPGPNDKNYVMRIKYEDFSTYWLGYPNGDVYAPRPKPQWVKVGGEYTAVFRRRGISEKKDLARHPEFPFHVD